MEGKENVFTQVFPLWTGRLVSPVKVMDLAQNYEFKGKMLWDTGAAMSVISQDVARACRLKPIVDGTMATLGTKPQEVALAVVLVFPGGIRTFMPLRAVVMDDLHTDVDVILGMDVIARGDFSLKRGEESVKLEFVFGEDFINK